MNSIERMNVRTLAEMVAESTGLAKLKLAAQLADTIKRATRVQGPIPAGGQRITAVDSHGETFIQNSYRSRPAVVAVIASYPAHAKTALSEAVEAKREIMTSGMSAEAIMPTVLHQKKQFGAFDIEIVPVKLEVAPPIVSIYNSDIGASQDQGQGHTDVTKPRTTISAVNKALITAGHTGTELVKGNGYFYFSGEEASSLYSSSVATMHLQDHTPDEWVKEYEILKADHARRKGEDTPALDTSTISKIDLEQLTTEAVAAFYKQEPRPKFGDRKDYVEDHILADGSKLTVTVSSFNRGGYMRHDWTHKVQLKINGKVASKDAVKKAITGDKPMSAANEVLKGAFEAQAPVVAADFIHLVRGFFENITERFGAVPSYPTQRDKLDDGSRKYYDSDIKVIRETLAPVCDTVKTDGDLSGMKSTLVINESKLAQTAKKYGDVVCLQWFEKTVEKLGDVEEAELLSDKGGYVSITGKRGGHKVFMRQQRILKWSPLGTPFNQFPAHLYIDGKFVTEAAYKAMFK